MRLLSPWNSLVVALLSSATAARGECCQSVQEIATHSPESLLVLGPAAPVPVLVHDATGASSAEFVPEWDPAVMWPAESDRAAWVDGGELTWQAVPTAQGTLGWEGSAASAPAVVFVATYCHVDRDSALTLRLAGSGTVRAWVDGAAIGVEHDSVERATALEHPTRWTRGEHRLLVRSEGDLSRFPIAIELECDPATQLTFDLDPAHAIAAYDELRQVASLSALCLSEDGRFLALRERRPANTTGRPIDRTSILDTQDGATLASDLGGGAANPIAWNSAGTQLLLRSGDDLLIYDRETRSLETVLVAEPGLGSVVWSAAGDFLVFTSTRGAESPTSTGPQRRSRLRQKLTDWPTAPHLHLLQLESGTRRRLTAPGDWVQDAFALRGDGRTLVSLRSIPLEQRPWFASQVCLLDLWTGEERVVQTLKMGFENRPGLSGMALSPDGSRLAFVGPPSELAGGAEPNAFDPDLFVMNLESGRWWKIGADLAASVEGHLKWAADSGDLWFHAHDGSRSALFCARNAREETSTVVALAASGHFELENLQDLAFAADSACACVASRTDGLPALWFVPAGATQPTLLRDPNHELSRRFELALPVDASFALADGTIVEGWLYRPTWSAHAGPGRLPLIVYYYGGATATARGFNELHQFLVGNGYALYVVNPRGATGYGQAFADLHAGDWGPTAGSDILAGVDQLLTRFQDLDPERVGCFGGSYGGFMTQYLLTVSHRFAAAVSLYGISNLSSYFGAGMWGYTYGDQAMAGRTPWADAQWYLEHSPLTHAAKITTPLLLLHGTSDGNVPAVESEQMFTALQLLGKEVEYVAFPAEDHGLRGNWENRVAHRTMLLEWFDKYLRNRSEAWDQRWR